MFWNVAHIHVFQRAESIHVAKIFANNYQGAPLFNPKIRDYCLGWTANRQKKNLVIIWKKNKLKISVKT